MFLCASLSLLVQIAARIMIQEIKTNGLLLRKIGQAYMYDRSLNLIITTPFNDFLKQQEKIESYIEQLENFRNCSENRVSIDFVITEFRFILSIINDMNRVISSTPHRGKREAYFPVVGTVFEIFFGSASEDTTNKLWNNLKKAENRMSALSDTMFKDHGSTVRLLSSIQEKNTDTDSRIKQMLSLGSGATR